MYFIPGELFDNDGYAIPKKMAVGFLFWFLNQLKTEFKLKMMIGDCLVFVLSLIQNVR